jgi:hypothetical protein
MVAERLWLETTRVVAVRLRARALSNTWWPVAIGDRPGLSAEDSERILALWLNSTLGVLSLMAVRVDTRGPWVELKKPIVEALLVLDVPALEPSQRAKLIRAYDDLCDSELLPVPRIDHDGVRAKIDAALMDALGLGDNLMELRRMMAAEPLLLGGRAEGAEMAAETAAAYRPGRRRREPESDSEPGPEADDYPEGTTAPLPLIVRPGHRRRRTRTPRP